MIATYKRFLVVFVSLLILNSCSGPEKEYILKIKLNKLTYEDMYKYNLVKDVIFDAEELNIDSIKNKSREQFLLGIDAYKNKKDPAAAIPLFKQSILTFPDAKTYYELGNALMEFKTNKELLKEAEDAYYVAEHLNIKPIYSVYYKLACAHNLLCDQSFADDRYRVISYLREAFHAGFSDTLAIEKDERLNSIVPTAYYRSLIRELRAENNKGDKNGLFELYKAAFPVKNNGMFEITLDDVAAYSDKESISYDFAAFIPEMQNTDFGREVSNDFFYVAMVQQTPVYTAVIYTSVSFWGREDDLLPSLTSIVTYTPKGTIIDRKLIACQCSAEKLKIAKISDNKIYVEDFKRVWKKPIDDVPFEENQVDKYVSLAKLTYELHEDGTIHSSEIPANYTDTVITKDQSKTPPL